MQRNREVALGSLKPHPQADLVPAMRPDEWEEFYRDVAFRGIKTPLEIAGDGTILDGHHRFKAAKELGLAKAPVTDAVLGSDSPLDYMLKAAVLRRHLTDDQRGMMAAMWIKQNRKQGERTDLETSVQRNTEVIDHPTREAAKTKFNVTSSKVIKANYVQNQDPVLATAVHKGDKKLNWAYDQVKEKKQEEAIKGTVLPAGQYQVIVIDPPWRYDSRASDPTHRGRLPYKSKTIEELEEQLIPAADNSIMWLWTTNSFLHQALHLMEHWGFEYKTMLTWAKSSIGLGDWLRGQTEHCLLGVKGNYRISPKSRSTLLQAPTGRHSEKPDEFYKFVDQLCVGTRIDMFARKNREGWDVWGAEVEG